MDTGLNNTNKLHLALNYPFMEDVEWIVEASDEERHQLWRDNHDRYKWEDINCGKLYNIVNLEISVQSCMGTKKITKTTKEVLPVYISFFFAIINGHKIAFYTSNSRLSHYGYIEAFLITYFQRTHDKYTRWNQTDANNFHNCVCYLDTVDIEHRNTTYKIDKSEKIYHIFKKI
jgi:hypothetical protein